MRNINLYRALDNNNNRLLCKCVIPTGGHETGDHVAKHHDSASSPGHQVRNRSAADEIGE